MPSTREHVGILLQMEAEVWWPSRAEVRRPSSHHGSDGAHHPGVRGRRRQLHEGAIGTGGEGIGGRLWEDVLTRPVSQHLVQGLTIASPAVELALDVREHLPKHLALLRGAPLRAELLHLRHIGQLRREALAQIRGLTHQLGAELQHRARNRGLHLRSFTLDPQLPHLRVQLCTLPHVMPFQVVHVVEMRLHRALSPLGGEHADVVGVLLQ
mmetsp:Transcript_13477/g.47533  ORF Transcript_13477/g.47533 Transcript_13477/m.47533 type:complete len:211 (+) Transcript_13477:232-864(+)